MTDFCNVTIVKAANIYFDGKVTSRTVKFPDGSHKTLGIMMPGEYSFSTRLRATTAGEFKVAPATLQSMYAPEFAAYSSGAELTIAGTTEED